MHSLCSKISVNTYLAQINGEISNIENHQEFAEKLRSIIVENHNAEKIKNSIKSRFSKDLILKSYEEVLLNI